MLALLLALLLAACGSPPAASTAPDFDLALAPDVVDLARGESLDVDVSVTAKGGAAAPTVSLAVHGLPSGVSATVKNATTLTLTADAAAPDGSATATVTGTSGGKSADAPLPVRVGAAAPTPVVLNVDPTLAPPSPSLPGVAGGPDRPVSRYRNPDGTVLDFVSNELLVRTDDAAALGAFLTRWSGTEVETIDLSGLGVGGFVPIHLVRIDPSGADTDVLAQRWEDAGLGGSRSASDDAAFELLAAAVDEASQHGLEVSLNPVLRSADFGSRSTHDHPSSPNNDPDGNPYTPDAFAWPYMRVGGPQDIGVAEAWRVLDAAGKLGNSVRMAILDGGFRPNADFPGFTAAGTLRVPNPDPTSCNAPAGAAPNPDCVWHGTHVSLAAAGLPDNDLGAAGPAGPVADLTLLPSPSVDVFEIFHYLVDGIPAALADRPRVVNLSFSADMPAETCLLALVGAPVCEILNGLSAGLRSAGILVVAAAGNDGKDVDRTKMFGIWPFRFRAEETIVIPCELSGVLCVGGLDWNHTFRDAASAWGSKGDGNSVDIFGPFDVWSVADPVAADSTAAGPDLTPDFVSGTSFASPFVAGVAALVWAADPSLTADQVATILIDTAHPGSGQVTRWVNALDAVQTALGGNTAPFVEITSPADGASRPKGSTMVSFAASGDDHEGDTLTYSWTSDRDGSIGSGSSFSTLGLSVGTHHITVRAEDPSGLFDTDTITLTITNDPPVVSIVQPSSSPVDVCAGANVDFQAVVSDVNEAPTYTLPGSAVHWRVGTASPFATGLTASRSFSVGSYSVIVRADDPDGAFDEDSVTVNASDCAPTDDPPTASITTPSSDSTGDNAAYAYDGYDSTLGLWYKDVLLQGSASDNQDGTLSGSSLTWTTSQSGIQAAILGHGASVTVRLYSNVCTGVTHTISLDAVDSDGNHVSVAPIRLLRIWTLC